MVFYNLVRKIYIVVVVFERYLWQKSLNHLLLLILWYLFWVYSNRGLTHSKLSPSAKTFQLNKIRQEIQQGHRNNLQGHIYYWWNPLEKAPISVLIAAQLISFSTPIKQICQTNNTAKETTHQALNDKMPHSDVDLLFNQDDQLKASSCCSHVCYSICNVNFITFQVVATCSPKMQLCTDCFHCRCTNWACFWQAPCFKSCHHVCLQRYEGRKHLHNQWGFRLTLCRHPREMHVCYWR